MTDGFGVRYAFLLGTIAITVGHRVDHDPEGDLHGGLLEIQRAYETTEGEFAFTEVLFREPIWRVDLCTWDEGEPGNWDRAHHHTRWNGMEPVEREYAEGLTRDPIAWTERQLSSIDSILRNGGSADLVGSVSQEMVDDATPLLIEALRRCMKDELKAAAMRRPPIRGHS